MNKNSINYVVNGVLLVAVIILFILQFTGGKGAGAANKNALQGGDSIAAVMPIAYVNLDSLLINYTYAIEAREKLMNKEETMRATLTEKVRSFESEAQDFQRKLNNNGFLTRERAETVGQQLEKKRQDLEELNAKMSQEFQQEQNTLNQQVTETIMEQLRNYNQGKKYQMILSNMMNDNILLADQTYDITQEVIGYLNKNYTPSNGK